MRQFPSIHSGSEARKGKLSIAWAPGALEIVSRQDPRNGGDGENLRHFCEVIDDLINLLDLPTCQTS